MSAAQRAEAPHALTVEAFGVRLRLAADTPEHLQRMAAVLPPGWRKADHGTESASFTVHALAGKRVELRRDGQPEVTAPALEAALELVERDVRALLARTSPDYVFVHAGAVEYGGRAIVIPGASFSGKSTLVAALVRRGARYYSDEFAVLDDAGLVHPFAKPLSLRPGGILQVDLPVQELAGTAGTEPVRVGAVVRARYRVGALWDPRELSPGEAVVILMEHAISALERPAAALRAISSAVADALVLDGERGDADTVAAAVISRLETQRARSAE